MYTNVSWHPPCSMLCQSPRINKSFVHLVVSMMFSLTLFGEAFHRLMGTSIIIYIVIGFFSLLTTHVFPSGRHMFKKPQRIPAPEMDFLLLFHGCTYLANALSSRGYWILITSVESCWNYIYIYICIPNRSGRLKFITNRTFLTKGKC